MTGFDVFGDAMWDHDLGAAIADMMFPVRCTWCSGVYDLAKVEVTAHYVDCSMWKAPCCGRGVDDRGETGWKSRKDYERLDKQTGDAR